MGKLSDDSKKIILNARQKRILREQGIPVEYENLVESQKEAIVAIEEMLKAAEYKYKKKFAYAGYIPGTAFEEEQLIAYPEDGSREDDSFTIKRQMKNGRMDYQDDYINIAVKPLFEKYLENFFVSEQEAGRVKVFAEVTKTDLLKVPEDFSDFDGNIISVNTIFIDGECFEYKKFNALMDNYREWLKNHRLPGGNEVILLKDNVFDEVSEENYYDYYDEEYYICRADCDLN
ncbi:MAG: hypothetical protein IJM37_07550 [Lachnospiraceae bacterium]|nr:hypothetical protein [Lachnospiraceae bacterium]